MESSNKLDITLFARALPQIAASLQPTSVGDVVALFLLAVLSLAYILRRTVWDKQDPYHHLYFERPQQQDGGSSRRQVTRDIAQKIEESNNGCVIFWGSQSGTA